MEKVEWWDYESGETLNLFRETQPFEVDGIVYLPPFRVSDAPNNSMFRLKDDAYIIFSGESVGRLWYDEIPADMWSDAKDFPGVENLTDLENGLVDA